MTRAPTLHPTLWRTHEVNTKHLARLTKTRDCVTMLLHSAVRIGVARDIVVIMADTLCPLNSPCHGFSMGIRTTVVVAVQVALFVLFVCLFVCLFFFFFSFFLFFFESDC